MSKVMTKNIKTYEALNILGWIESENGVFINTKLPIKVQWGMKKNIDTLLDIRKTYSDFYEKIQQKYADDEYSSDVEENGEIKRIVKEEYLEDFNKELMDIVNTETEGKIVQFNIDEFGDIEIDAKDMSVLSFFIIDEIEE